MTRPSTTLSKPSAWPPVKGRPSPDGEKAGQRARSLAGQGCASSHWRQRHAKLSGFWSSYRNHISRAPHSMLSRSHLEGAERPRRRSPFLREATVAAVFGKSLPFLSTQLKLQRRTNVSPSNDAVHSSLRAPVDRAWQKATRTAWRSTAVQVTSWFADSSNATIAMRCAVVKGCLRERTKASSPHLAL